MRSQPSLPLADVRKISIPTSPEQANDTLRMLAETSRRSFLGRGLAAAAVPAAVLGASSTSEAASTSPFPSFYPGNTTATFQEIQVDEATHVNILLFAIRSLGGTPRPYPTFQGIQNLNAAQFLQTAIAFENTGVHAYFGAAPYISNPAVTAVALSIALVEGYHSGFLNRLGQMPLIPGGLTYATPYTIPQVLAAAGPHIASLNDDGMFPMSFSTTPSPANDLAILNFALTLEFLESAFYFYNVPRLFH